MHSARAPEPGAFMAIAKMLPMDKVTRVRYTPTDTVLGTQGGKHVETEQRRYLSRAFVMHKYLRRRKTENIAPRTSSTTKDFSC